MIDAAIEVSAIRADQQCAICDVNAKLRCNDCGVDQFFCYECAIQLHRQRKRLHFIEEWKVRNLPVDSGNQCFIDVNGRPCALTTASCGIFSTKL